MSSNALVIYERFDQLATAADALHKSGFFSDVKSQAQAIVKVMAGAELGLPPFASMTGIHIIQGKPALGSNVIATLVKNSGRYDYRVMKATDTECSIDWYENGQKVGSAGFTMAEAQAANLTGKATWKQYPSDMLFARAISRGARRFAPGIFGGAPVYTPEELGADTDEEGYIIEGEINQPEPTGNGHRPEPPAEPEPASPRALDANKWTEAISWLEGEANNGKVVAGKVNAAAAMTGTYKNANHAAGSHKKLYSDYEPGKPLATEEAIGRLNELVQRRIDTGDFVDVDAINGELFAD